MISRKAFYEMLIDEWCDGERSVLVSTHQVEEIETPLSDVLMLDEGRLVLSISLEDMDKRFVALSHDAGEADAMAAAHPLLRYRTHEGSVALFDGTPPESVLARGRRVRPSLVDLFIALTRRPGDQPHPGSPPMKRFSTLLLREWMQHRFGWIAIVAIPAALFAVVGIAGHPRWTSARRLHRRPGRERGHRRRDGRPGDADADAGLGRGGAAVARAGAPRRAGPVDRVLASLPTGHVGVARAAAGAPGAVPARRWPHAGAAGF